ncbi:hypothetical protein RB594_003014 [Gaeumannomyces avenae]
MATITATPARQDGELSPRQHAPASMEDAINSLGSMKDGLGPLGMDSLDLRADPDAQATITDFLDFTEYLPADMTRSLTLIGKLDQTYIDASNIVHNLTKSWGELPNTPADERPHPVQLRAEISKNLGHVMSSRTYAHAEAARMAENATRHYNRAKIIVAKLQTMLENYPTAEEQQKSPVLAAKTAQASRANKMGVRLDGRKGRSGRSVPRITVPGEVLPPYDLDFAAYGTDEESSSEDEDDEDDEDDDEATAAPSVLASQPRAKAVKNPKPPKTPKPPKGSVAAQGVSRPTQPVPPMSSLKPPPENAVVGSADAPWLQLTAWELARLRKRMKKNAQWSPSDTMIARELKALGRGPEAYNKAKQLAEEQGKPFEATIPASIPGADGVEHPPMGALSLDAALAAEDKQSNNRGLKLNVAKKLKKENLAKLAAELAEESARKMEQEVNALLFPTPQKQPEKPGPEPASSRNPRKYGGRKRKRDSVAEPEDEKPGSGGGGGGGPAPGPAETPLQKRTKTETPVPLPQQAPSLASASQESQLQPPPVPNPQSTSPIPIPVLAQEQLSVTSAQTLSNSPPASAATVTTIVPVKPPADLVVPPQSPKKSTTPILPPVRETRKSSQAVKKEQEQEQQQQQQQPQQQQQQQQLQLQQKEIMLPVVVAASGKPAGSSSRAGTPSALGSSRPSSREKAGSSEPPQSLASDRPRRTSTARNTPAPEQRQHGKPQRPKRPAPGVISRTISGGSSAVGKRKAPTKKKSTRVASLSHIRKCGGDAEGGEVEVDDEGNAIDPEEERYCLCNRVSFGTMIQCENVENCKHEWFHLECVDMDILPARTTKWYCPACRKLLNIGEKGEVSARGVRA